MENLQELQQGNPQWIADRIGKATGSRIADIMAKNKSGVSASRANYMAELIAERLSGKPAEHYKSPEMIWGTEHEPEAKNLYALMTNQDVADVGFVEHPTIAMSGASPDLLVGIEGLAEFKCPNTATHLDFLLGASIPGKYVLQMQWQMACSRRTFNDFVSFDPRLPPSMRLFVERFERDSAKIVEIEREVRDFLAELDQKLANLKRRFES